MGDHIPSFFHAGISLDKGHERELMPAWCLEPASFCQLLAQSAGSEAIPLA